MTSITSRVIATLIFVGVPMSNVNAKVKELLRSEVNDCQFLADVKGSSGYGKDVNWRQIAKEYALKKADSVGATHVVWTSIKELGVLNGEANGIAYRCN